MENFPLSIRHSCTTLRVKNSLKIALSLTVFEIFILFHFPQKSRWLAKVMKIEIFPFHIGHSCITLRVKNSLEIALSLMVFEIFTLFHFPPKSKMAGKSDENSNFSVSHRSLLYYPAGQKFPRNRSISYGFRDICDFAHFH